MLTIHLTSLRNTANAEVRRYFSECGFEVVRDRCLQCPSWTAIAEVTSETCRQVLRELDGDDVDAILQVGTNLSMIRLAAAAELWLRKPVIATGTLRDGPLGASTHISARLPRPVFGLGLLEAVPTETILGLADPDDKNGDS